MIHRLDIAHSTLRNKDEIGYLTLEIDERMHLDGQDFQGVICSPFSLLSQIFKNLLYLLSQFRLYFVLVSLERKQYEHLRPDF